MYKKLLILFVAIVSCFAASAETKVETYTVTQGCSALNLDKGDIVKVAIPNPTSWSTRISVVNGFKADFVMEPARGMASGGSTGYSSNYTIYGKNVRVHRNNREIIVTQGEYNFKLRKN